MTKQRVLVLDDEPGVAMLCRRLLVRAGYNVTEETDPRQAMDRLERESFDLMVVDIRMPGVDGFEVIAHARSHQPELAILVMTGFGTVETAIRALRQGVDGLILKPFAQGDELVTAARQALADSQNKRDSARMQALRPLFDVTESLLTETRPERLLDLIVSAISGHVHSPHTGIYRFSTDDHRLHLVAGRGRALPEEASSSDGGLLGRADALGLPVWVNQSGPGDDGLRALLAEHELGGVMCVPIARLNVRGVLYAGRDPGEPAYREADLELFLILARQAAVALENASLYGELRDYVRRVEDSQRALLQAEKMAAAGRLTASIAHEINNPLQSVQNCLHLAGRDDLPDEKRKEYFDLANTELERLMVTVRRMLDFYRPGAASTGPVDTLDLLQHVLGLTDQQLRQRGIIVALDVPASLPEVQAVSGQVQQVFINLILNAYDAMPEGGTLSIRARTDRSNVEFLFEDSGPGIPQELRTSIFEPFMSTKAGGTGLGLTVSYNIVSAHGGTLDLVPGQGSGACFRLTLPRGGKPCNQVS